MLSEPNAPSMLRGKINWFSETNIKKDAPDYLYLFKQKPIDEDLDKLKNHLCSFLKTKGFVFFEKCWYRYRLNPKGHLKEIGINYCNIK